MRCFSNIMFNFALILHLLVDSIPRRVLSLAGDFCVGLFGSMRKCL